jgi:hypothetical protein
VKEYELFLPLTHNDGSPIDAREIEIVGDALLAQFGGMTFAPQPKQGRWRMGGVEFRDAIVIFRVFTEQTREARRFFKKLKKELMVKLQQEEILIVEKDARLL